MFFHPSLSQAENMRPTRKKKAPKKRAKSWVAFADFDQLKKRDPYNRLAIMLNKRLAVAWWGTADIRRVRITEEP